MTVLICPNVGSGGGSTPTGGLIYRGSYDAATNSPDLTSAQKGDFYIVSVGGTLAGVTLNVGDHIIFNQNASSPITSSMFDVIDNTDAVASVNGQTGVVVLDTDDVSEGSTNQYFTDARADARADVRIGAASVNDLSDVAVTTPTNGQALLYNQTSGNWENSTLPAGGVTSVNTQTGAVVLDSDDISEGSTNLYYTDGRFDTRFATKSTTDLSEGTNLYYTDARADARIGAANIDDLNDVTVTTPSNGQVLLYNSTSSEWENGAVPSAPVSSVNTQTGAVSLNLDDVVTVGATTTTAITTGGLTVTGDIDPNADVTYYLGDENNRFISYYGDMNGAIRFKAKVDQAGGLTKGEVVYINGLSGTGNVPTVAKAQANSSSTMPAFGLVYASANDTADVEIITFGNLEGLVTNTFSAGTNLYVSSTTAGGLVNSAPTGESNLIQNIGFVVKSDASAGIIKVGGAGRTNATPNLDQDKIFLGNGSNQAVSTALSSIALSGFNNDLTLANVVANGDSTTVPVTIADLSLNANASGTSTSGSISTTASNYNIKLDPHGSGVAELIGNTTRGSGQLQFNCELNSHGVKLQGPPHSAAATYTMILPDALGTTGQYLRLQDQSTGELYFSDATSTDTLDDVTTNGATTSNALTTGNLLPNTAGVNTLGSNTKEWGNVYLADNTNMYFGADQDVILKHDADSGLTVKMSATAQNNNTPRFVLQNEGTTFGSKFVQVFNETNPSPNDVIGYLIGNARNSNNVLLDFTQIESVMIDNTHGQLQSGLVFRVRRGNTGALDEGLKVFSDSTTDTAPKVRISDAFTMPSTDGSANQVLSTDGSGNVTWQTLSASPLAYDGTQGTANFSTIEGTHYSVNTSGASADITATLPSASVSNAGKEVRFKLMDATHGLVIAVQTNQILEGTTNGTYTLNVALQSITCVSNGNNGWEII